MGSSSVTGAIIQWTEKLTVEQRQGLLLLREYGKQCRQHFGGGYRDPIMDETCVSRPAFKQAVTVAKWLTAEGMKVGVAEINWGGFVEYVFEHFARLKNIPAVGQLKNPVLVQKYFQHASISVEAPEGRPDSEMEQLYSRVLLPEIGQNYQMLYLLGLRKSDRQ
jgi:hypothetical protein